jgi:hypothetical protein
VSYDDTAVMEAAHTGADSPGALCEQCDPPKRVKDLPRHRYRVHGKGSDRARQDRPPGSPSRGPKLPSRAALKADLQVTFTFIAEIVRMRDPVCGDVALQQVPQIVNAWDSWAASSPAVRRALGMAMAGAGPLGVVIAHVPIFLVVAAHHGPNREQYFPPAPPPADYGMNGAAAEAGAGGAAAYAGGPIGSEYGVSDNGAPPI